MTKYTLLYTNHFAADFNKALAWYDDISTHIGDKFQIAFYNAEERLLQKPIRFQLFKKNKVQKDTF